MNEVTKVMLIRGMTFLGYTNRFLDKKLKKVLKVNDYLKKSHFK
jgi:hypothetical protein